MNVKKTTIERYSELVALLEKMPLPENCTAAYHLYKATKDDVNNFAAYHNKIAYQRPGGELYINFKYAPNIDIYIWE